MGFGAVVALVQEQCAESNSGQHVDNCVCVDKRGTLETENHISLIMTMALKDFEKYPDMRILLLAQKALAILIIVDTNSDRKIMASMLLNVYQKCMYCIIQSVKMMTGLLITIALELKFSTTIIVRSV